MCTCSSGSLGVLSKGGLWAYLKCKAGAYMRVPGSLTINNKFLTLLTLLTSCNLHR